MIGLLQVVYGQLVLASSEHEEGHCKGALLSLLVNVDLITHQLQLILRQLHGQEVAHEELEFAELIREWFLGVIELQIHDLFSEIFLQKPYCTLRDNLLEFLSVQN
jgi:hypothetical protein